MIHVDGGARGNPGPAGAGIVIRDEAGKRLFEAGYFLGRQTNNFAEYTALIRALERVTAVAVDRITICSDSQLLVRQITGEYQVKSPTLAPLFEQAQRLLLKAPRWSVRHVPREENSAADRLANLAMDQGQDVIVFDGIGVATTRADVAARPAPEASSTAPTAAAPPRSIEIRIHRPPPPGGCPASDELQPVMCVTNTLPSGLCIHAAHGIVPTVLAMANTDPSEFSAIPTLTVRCSKPDCGATFHIQPRPSGNGH